MAKFNYCVFLVLASFLIIDAADQSVYNTVFLRLYNKDGHFTDKNIKNAAEFVPNMDKSKTVTIYIHGYKENADTARGAKLVTNAYLQYTDHNVLALDYRDIAKMFYPTILPYLPHLGTIVANAFNSMLDAGISAQNFHIIGHSLGSEVAGYVGRDMKTKISRITGLDPAGPLFYITTPHLNSSDAEFVDIIHTDKGFYGLDLKIGQVDFYPNGGHRVQPGCPLVSLPLSSDDFCSHHRSYEFYAESIKNPQAFIAESCDNEVLYRLKKCTNNLTVPMGYKTPRTATGSFYLRTGSKSPFGLGVAGAQPA